MKYWREVIICGLIATIIIKHNNTETEVITNTVEVIKVVKEPCPETFKQAFKRNPLVWQWSVQNIPPDGNVAQWVLKTMWNKSEHII